MKRKSAKHLLEDHILKVLSIFSAFFLWFYVVNSEPIIVKRLFRINVQSPVDKAVNGLSHQTIEVDVKGARAFVEDYVNDDSPLVIDLQKEKDNEVLYKVSKKDFVLPFGVEIHKIIPSNIKVNFDREIKKLVPVKLTEEGELPNQLHFTKKSFEPREVMIVGPINIMRTISTVKTMPIIIEDLSGSETVNVELQKLPQFISYEDVDNVKFSYDVRPKSANFNLKNIEITFISKTKSYFTKTKEVSIDILAPEEISLKRSDIKVYAEIPNSSKKNVKVRLRAQLPEGVHLLQIHPQIIDVRLD